MAEYMRIDDSAWHQCKDDYWKFVLNVKYTFNDYAFILFEYGHELVQRQTRDREMLSNHGDMLGVRFGFQF